MSELLVQSWPEIYPGWLMVGPWGEAIRRARKDRRMSQKALAKLARISPTTMSAIERGGHTQTSVLEKIAQALGVDVATILVSQRQLLEQDERKEVARLITEDVLRRLDPRVIHQEAGAVSAPEGFQDVDYIKTRDYEGPGRRRAPRERRHLQTASE